MAAHEMLSRFLHRLPPPANWLVKGSLLQMYLSWEVLSLLLLWLDLVALHTLSHIPAPWAFWTFYALGFLLLSLFLSVFFFGYYVIRTVWILLKRRL